MSNEEKKESQSGYRTVLEATVRDWRMAEGVDLPDEDTVPYRLKVEFNPHTGQMIIGMFKSDGVGLDLAVEVNEGVPCLHISNQEWCDNIAHVFVTPQGVVMQPDSTEDRIETIPPGKFTYNLPGAAFIESIAEPEPAEDLSIDSPSP